MISPFVRRALWVVSLGAMLVGCGGNVIVVNGIEVYEKQWQKVLTDLGPRASYDLNCPRDHLEFTLLKRTGTVPTEVGVAGCGIRATYLKHSARAGGYNIISNDWVMNNDSRVAPGGSQPAGQTQPAAQAQTTNGLAPNQYGQPVTQ